MWADMKHLSETQNSIRQHVFALENLKKDLQLKKLTTESKKTDLEEYQGNLSDQKKTVVYNTQEKNKLLSDTKNKEAEYQKLLANKKALRDAFQKELTEYESQLRIAIDPNSYPQGKSGILSWPLTKVIITQKFGNTEFSAAHAQLYNGSGHNGVDMGTPIGTPVKAALGGTIMGTGDTDLACPGASFGRWVLIRHNNGLSSLYAHLSVISVAEGQTVTTGSTIGYSGNTGYSTGPHLHFTVYASQGVQIVDRASKSCGGRTYHMPVADLRAYLDPLAYLPAI
jgi:murein DD-endopeptidase MepM/ murein hydrolase activator NlpD